MLIERLKSQKRINRRDRWLRISCLGLFLLTACGCGRPSKPENWLTERPGYGENELAEFISSATSQIESLMLIGDEPEIDPAAMRALARVYNERGGYRWLKGELAIAGEDFEKAIQLDPELIGAWLNLGALERLDGRPKDSLKTYSEAYNRADSEIERQAVLIQTGWLKIYHPELFDKKGLPEWIQTDLRKIFEYPEGFGEEEWANTLLLRGVIFRYEQRALEGKDDFEKLEQAELYVPDKAFRKAAHMNLALLHLSYGEVNIARSKLVELEEKERDSRWYGLSGIGFYQRSEFSQAAEAWEKAETLAKEEGYSGTAKMYSTYNQIATHRPGNEEGKRLRNPIWERPWTRWLKGIANGKIALSQIDESFPNAGSKKTERLELVESGFFFIDRGEVETEALSIPSSVVGDPILDMFPPDYLFNSSKIKIDTLIATSQPSFVLPEPIDGEFL